MIRVIMRNSFMMSGANHRNTLTIRVTYEDRNDALEKL